MPVGVQALFSQNYIFKMTTDPGFAIEVGPTIHIPLPSKVVHDTEKFSGQVTLKDESSGGKSPTGYVAGEPFPNPSEPDKAYKVLYNNWYRWYPFVQSFHSHTNLVDRYTNLSYQLGQTTYWRLSHLSDDDYPTNLPYAAGYVLNARFFIMLPEQSNYTGDDGAGTSVTSPALFKAELLGEYKVLGLLHEDPVAREKDETFMIKSSVPGWPTPKDGKWELRDTYVMALYPLPVLGSGYCYGVRIVYYIDKE